MTLHVVPIDDLIEHATTDDCACGPTPQPIKHQDGPIRWAIVHHSLDGRERQENPCQADEAT